MGRDMSHDEPGMLYIEDVFALATKFADLVERQPSRFIPSTKWWQNISRAEVLNKLLDRASERITPRRNSVNASTQSPTENDWANWLGTTKWIMDHQWSRHAVSTFLSTLVESHHAIPQFYVPELPGLLCQLCQESDPRLMKGGSFGDWLTIALNSTRGQTMQTILGLALRQKNAGQKVEPWVFQFICDRLRVPDESPAIFALLGAKLPLLIHLFGQELKQIQGLLFPSARLQHRAAAIVAHFLYCRASTPAIETFPDIIPAALETLEMMQTELKENRAKDDLRDFGARLGVQIASYHWNGSFKNEVEGETTLNRFFAIAGKNSRASLIGQIASIWEKPPHEGQSPKMATRAMGILDRRIVQILKSRKSDKWLASEFEGELSKVFDWLECENFPFEWRFNHAMQAIELLEKAPRPYDLLKAISRFGIVPERLEAMLQLLDALLKKTSDELRWWLNFKDLGPVISLGLASNNANTRRLAKACKDFLLKMGFSDFLDVGTG